MAIDFRYVPPSGPISGIEFEKQTQMVINELGQWIGGLEKISENSLKQSENAQKSASRAEGEALNALTSAEVAKQEASQAVIKAANALEQSLAAQTKASSAYDTAMLAKDSSANSSTAVTEIRQSTEEALALSRSTEQNLQKLFLTLEGLSSIVDGFGQYEVNAQKLDANELYDRQQKLYLTSGECLNFPVSTPFYLDISKISDSSAVKQTLFAEAVNGPVCCFRLGTIEYESNKVRNILWGPWASSAKSADIGGIPKGLISMWSGSVVDIPDGWALCDGYNGTPNLSDRFVVAAGNAYSPGEQGGSLSHTHNISGSVNPTTLTEEQMPRHSHAYDYSTLSGSGLMSAGGRSLTGGIKTSVAGGSQAHTHGLSLNPSDEARHLPLFYALAFIMKL